YGMRLMICITAFAIPVLYQPSVRHSRYCKESDSQCACKRPGSTSFTRSMYMERHHHPDSGESTHTGHHPKASASTVKDNNVEYSCPMHPEVRQMGPGTCPKCGMALEPVMPSAEAEQNPELTDFRRRFWYTLPLTVLVTLIAMSGGAFDN